MNNELFDALEALENEKGVKAEHVLASISNAISVAVKKYYNVADECVDVEIDTEAKKFKVSLIKEIVAEVEDPQTQIHIDEALLKNKRAKVGSKLNMKLDTKQIGRIAALSGKNLIHQGISEAVKAQMMEQYQSKLHEAVTAKVQKVEPRTGNATISIDKNEAILFKGEQIPGEVLVEGDNIKVYVNDVVSTERRCSIKVTRTHKDLVKRLFEMEVPEIFNGIVEIKGIAREPGQRTKVAVLSNNPDIDPKGACIGHNFSRVGNIMRELKGEKVDIVKYSEDPLEYVKCALAPSKVLEVSIPNPEERTCRVIVPDSMLSLAIGNKGLNAKLAAKLTGFKIDIRPESGIVDGKKIEDEEPAAAKNESEEAVSEINEAVAEAAEIVEEPVAEALEKTEE